MSLLKYAEEHSKADTTKMLQKDVAGVMGRTEELDPMLYQYAVDMLKDQVKERVFTHRYILGLMKAYYYLGDKQKSLAVAEYAIDRALKDESNKPTEYLEWKAFLNTLK